MSRPLVIVGRRHQHHLSITEDPRAYGLAGQMRSRNTAVNDDAERSVLVFERTALLAAHARPDDQSGNG
jgi:hypothetical protein